MFFLRSKQFTLVNSNPFPAMRHPFFAIATAFAFAAVPATVLAAEPAVTATFSILAVDPETGVCGAAVASKYPAVGKVVPYCRPGVGVLCTQHWHNPKWAGMFDGGPPDSAKDTEAKK